MKNLIELAMKVEGLPRHSSVHAAGVVIAPRPLDEVVPLQKTPEDAVVTQFTMDILAGLGLLKMDFLGLRTLSIIEDGLENVKDTTGEVIDIDEIPLDDPAVYEMLSRGNTAGVFQFETSGLTDLLKRLRPTVFEDLTAAVALFRPGPMAMLDDFIDGRHGRKKVEYAHPSLEDVLSETYGVMIYQEQVMRVASVLAGFSMAEADTLRTVFKKKSPELMAAQKDKFVKGAVAQGVDKKTANDVFEMVARFAGYGFNKSHSAPYALVAYQTAWLKAHYPVQFMAACLTSVMDSSDRVALYADECRRSGIEVLPPDVNASQAGFSVAGDNHAKIRFGLTAVKNLGSGAIESILAARGEGGAFRSLYGFCRRVDTRQLNKRAIESMIKAGAFDSLGGHRGQYLLALDRDLEAAQRQQKLEREGQMSLFGGGNTGSGAPGGADAAGGQGFAGFEETPSPLPPCDPLPRSSILAMEKEVLGLYVSGHPLADFQETLTGAGAMATAHLPELPENEFVTIGGMLSETKKHITKKGQQMMFTTLEDLTGTVEVIVFPSVYETFADLLQPDAILVIHGRINYKDEDPKVIAEEIQPLATARVEAVYVDIPPDMESYEILERIKAVLGFNQGEAPVYLRFESCGQTVLTDRECWIRLGSDALAMLEEVVGPDRVSIVAM